jgi:phosphate transport system substrate-binding protein
MRLAEVINVWGTPAAQAVVRRWELGFKQAHPGFHIAERLTGSDIGMAGLYTGFADLAVLGRECTQFESKAFEWIFRYPPARVQVSVGSLNGPERSGALLVFVHRDNPLPQLTLGQLDAIFSPERLRGAPGRIAWWGDLGLAGEWANRPIRLYADHAESGTGRFFRSAVLEGSAKRNWDALTEFQGQDAGRKVLAALAVDRYGLAVTAGVGEHAPEIKTVAVARGSADEAVVASAETLISLGYPLTRAVHVYFNRRPGSPVDARLDDFLRYILSEPGQRDLSDEGSYLPLSAQLARQQMEMLG